MIRDTARQCSYRYMLPMLGREECEQPALLGQNRCLFHAPAEAKDAAAFYSGIEDKMGREDYQFIGYVFPPRAVFGEAQFSGNANFSWAQFTDGVTFWRAQFSDGVTFWRARFSGEANFSEARFTGMADFTGAQFSNNAYFRKACFKGAAAFQEANFSGDANFYGAHFSKNATFHPTHFGGPAYFGETQFCRDADFQGAQFEKDAHFYKARFKERAIFVATYFKGYTEIKETKFPNGVDFTRARWLERALFEGAELGPNSSFQEADLALVTFRSLDLSNCSFRSAYGIESAEFDNIIWDRRYGRDSIADEVAARSALEKAQKSGTPEEVKTAVESLNVTERVYLHLRRSYQARLDYTRAREFYYGEMERRRLASGPWQERLLINLFWRVSGYGQRWVQAAAWLMGILLVFALAYAFSGLVTTPGKPPLQIVPWWNGLSGPLDVAGLLWDSVLVTTPGETLLQIIPGENGRSGLLDVAGVLGKSLLYSINVAVLRPGDFAQPFSWWGRTFQALELVLGPAFITILVLAIREQFRR